MDKERLLGDLAALGLKAGDVAMVHASLRKLGLARVDIGAGGADLVLDALDAADLAAFGAGWTERNPSPPSLRA